MKALLVQLRGVLRALLEEKRRPLDRKQVQDAAPGWWGLNYLRALHCILLKSALGSVVHQSVSSKAAIGSAGC